MIFVGVKYVGIKGSTPYFVFACAILGCHAVTHKKRTTSTSYNWSGPGGMNETHCVSQSCFVNSTFRIRSAFGKTQIYDFIAKQHTPIERSCYHISKKTKPSDASIACKIEMLVEYCVRLLDEYWYVSRCSDRGVLRNSHMCKRLRESNDGWTYQNIHITYTCFLTRSLIPL